MEGLRPKITFGHRTSIICMKATLWKRDSSKCMNALVAERVGLVKYRLIKSKHTSATPTLHALGNVTTWLSPDRCSINMSQISLASVISYVVLENVEFTEKKIFLTDVKSMSGFSQKQMVQKIRNIGISIAFKMQSINIKLSGICLTPCRSFVFLCYSKQIETQFWSGYTKNRISIASGMACYPF